ncbi:hypothetical protein Vretimale_5532 [Volvox reticuliferus]|uniref:Uncharacterized protein n=1 Tax=Volvox reticuliferus TaxID=1737510 RepID=A0A8J4LL27_9CHLO|nr:hypothetical protein Vretimale_5532 [Volvox reticuliferus]
MPRIRKLQPVGASRKLGECFRLLLSGASGECLAGELGCCGDSCCSAAVVSRSLAEYCQHSDAAREAFVAAQGVDALQVALTRGSASVATAAARVLGALCASPHGLRCVLRWQRDSGSTGDLLSTLAAAASQVELPPDLRAECVDALRCALGSLHGPAAGGGLELAGMLQDAAGGLCGFNTAGDFLTKVALPPLLSANTHLRAAAARLIAVAVEEGVLPTGAGGDGAAASLLAALGLATNDGRALDSCELTRLGLVSEPGDEDLKNPSTAVGARRALALCELVAALLGSPQGAEVLVAMRAPFHVLELCRESLTDSVSCGGLNHVGGWLQDSSDGGAVREALLDAVLLCVREGPQKLWTAADEVSWREMRAFVAGAAMLATLLLSRLPARADASAIATAPNLLITARADGGPGEPAQGETALSTGTTSTAAALASALASWPREVLGHADLRLPFADLLTSLSSAAVTLLHGCCPGPHRGSANNGIMQSQLQLNWAPAAPMEEGLGSGNLGRFQEEARLGLVGSDHRNGNEIGWCADGGATGSKALDKKAFTLRVMASSAAAMLRLYGAMNGSRSNSLEHVSGGRLHDGDQVVHAGDDADPVMNACAPGSLCGDNNQNLVTEALGSATVAQCLGRFLEAACDSAAATAGLFGPFFEALLELDVGQLEALGAQGLTPLPATDGGVRGSGHEFSLAGLGLAAIKLVERLLPLATGDKTAPPLHLASSGGSAAWELRACGSSGGLAGYQHWSQGPAHSAIGHCSSDQHATLLAALLLWAKMMSLVPVCMCGRQIEGAGLERHIITPCLDAYELRPIGPLLLVTEAAERLLSLADDLGLTTITDYQNITGAVGGLLSGCHEFSAQPGYWHDSVLARGAPMALGNVVPVTIVGLCRLASSKAAAGCCNESSAGRSTALLLALVDTLRVAVSRDTCKKCQTKQAPDPWNQLRARVHELTEYVSARPVSRQSPVMATARQLQEDGGEFIHNNAGDTPDPHQAATLADADTILDECLACIGAGMVMSETRGVYALG